MAGPISHGVYDYQLLRGETGPLVYPGGFVWLFGALRWFAGGDGSDVRVAQWVFLGVYMGTLMIILALYAIARPKYMSPWASVLLVVSKRAHSVYMLRLFNDCWAMFFLYAAILLYVLATKYKKEFCWTIGCVLYSIAVSIKMNIFLTAPALLLLLLMHGGIMFAATQIFVCAVVQLLVGAPLLLLHPVNYIKGAFGGFGDLKHKWTVNLKFMPEDLFLSRWTTVLLLGSLVVMLVVFFIFKWTSPKERGLLLKGCPGLMAPERVLTTMLTCNFVGIVFSRSLHFQFHCWYFHALPLLLWRAAVPTPVKLMLFALLEYAWSWGLTDDTSTAASALALQCAHSVLLIGLLASPMSYYFISTSPAQNQFELESQGALTNADSKSAKTD